MEGVAASVGQVRILWWLAGLRGSPGDHLRAGILRWSAGILWSYSTEVYSTFNFASLLRTTGLSSKNARNTRRARTRRLQLLSRI